MPETHDVLWVPKDFHAQSDRMDGRFNGKGEAIDIQHRLQMGITDSGNLMLMIFDSECKFVKKQRSSSAKFASALALTLVASSFLFQIVDNEDPGSLSKMIKWLADYWRSRLLKKTDTELGLGLDGAARSGAGATPSITNKENLDDGGMSEQRRILYNLLADITKSFEGHGYKFYWKPSRSRKRSCSATAQKDAGGFVTGQSNNQRGGWAIA